MRDMKNSRKRVCFVILPCLVIKSPDFSEEHGASMCKVTDLLLLTTEIISATLKMEGEGQQLYPKRWNLITPRCIYANDDNCGH
jgi:hypothetical protein